MFTQDRDETGKLLFDEFQSVEGIGIATGLGANGLPFYGVDAQGFETLELRLADGDDNYTVVRTYAGTADKPGQNVVIDAGGGNDTIHLGQLGGLALIYGGAGNDTVNVRDTLTQKVWTTATSGNFTLSFSGQTTAAIPFNATASTVKSALAALSNIPDVNGVDVTGSGTLADPWVVNFITFSSAVMGAQLLTASSGDVTIKAGSLAGIANRVFFDGDAHIEETVVNVASTNPDFSELLRNAPLVYINTIRSANVVTSATSGTIRLTIGGFTTAPFAVNASA